MIAIKKSTLFAAMLCALHIAAWVYVNASGITYDAGGYRGLLWFAVAFLVLPLLALTIVVLSWIKSKIL